METHPRTPIAPWRPLTTVTLGLVGVSVLAGCDGLLIAATLPAPISGRVVDSRTALPLGKATVMAGLVSTTTDNAGNFTLWGDLGGNKSLSIARAGYVSVTYEVGKLAQGDTYFLTPNFVTSGTTATRFLNLTGTLCAADGKTPLAGAGNVSFGGAKSTSNLSSGRYTINASAAFPGAIYSGVLAGGQITASTTDNDQPFTFITFGYRLVDIPTTATDGGSAAQADLAIQADMPFTEMSIGYKGTEAFTSPTPRTEVTLDFGLLGSVLVARGFSTNQGLRVPRVDGAKYVIDGQITDDTQHAISVVSITTDQTSPPALTFLAPPKVIGPVDGASGSANPTFAWKAVSGARSYYVEVNDELGNGATQPKWRGYTTSTSIRYPGFWDSDPNGGVLYPGASYSWKIHALASDTGYNAPASVQPDLPTPGSRARRRESITYGMRFAR